MPSAATTGTWGLIGPTGVTGRLVLDEALARGHQPVLMGRDRGRLAQLAQPHGLAIRVIDAADKAGLAAAFAGLGAVFNVAGPFAVTGRPVLEAALAARVPYLDLNGELAFLLEVLAADGAASAAGIPLIAGAGFGVAAGDCLAAFVAAQIAAPTSLRLAVAPASAYASPAVAASTVAALEFGGRRIAGGKLVSTALGDRTWNETTPDGAALPMAAAPLAELAALGGSTGIAEIMTGTPMPRAAARAVRLLSGGLKLVLAVPAIRRMAVRATGHSAATSTADAGPFVSRVWATASNARGETVRGLLETGEGYAFAASAAVLAVERVLQGGIPAGAHTPAAAFGTDFALAIPGTTMRVL